MKARAAELAAQGVYLGTSSWKYAGWLGQLYEAMRYDYRGKVAMSRFERNCLAEYAQVFKTVCVDAAYYDFPRVESLLEFDQQTPPDFRFGFKVTDVITMKHFPNLPRMAARAGLRNPDFLNAELFANSFLGPCERIRSKVGVLMFEFSRFGAADYGSGREFVAELDAFLARLPAGWPYAVEMRNRQWLQDDYFQCLARHRVTHVFNSWQAMPPVGEQMALPLSRTNDELTAARFLLSPGRKYEEAVKTFQPYDATKIVDDAARQAGAELIAEGIRYEPRKKTYIYVNNRLEGNALSTLEAMISLYFAARGQGG